MWRKGNPHMLLTGMLIGAATVEYSTEVSQKIKNRVTICPAIPLLDIDTQKKKNTSLERYVHPNVHSTAIHYCPDMEAP